MNLSNKVRLTEKEIEIIKSTIFSLDPEANIILFGSRTDLTKKGGDIDLLIVSRKLLNYKLQRKIKTELYLKLGDRKIDLIFTDNPNKSEFTKIAFKYGVKL